MNISQLDGDRNTPGIQFQIEVDGCAKWDIMVGFETVEWVVLGPGAHLSVSVAGNNTTNYQVMLLPPSLTASVQSESLKPEIDSLQ